MDDESIIRLYWERDERAIEITAEKYGPYCGAIAGNILGSREDREECLNDTYIRAWNSMPKDWPRLLQAYLGRITRNLAFNRYRRELIEAIGVFLRGLPENKRSIFVRRYWYADRVDRIARDRGMAPGAVSKTLERIRKQLRGYLTERGFEL